MIAQLYLSSSLQDINSKYFLKNQTISIIFPYFVNDKMGITIYAYIFFISNYSSYISRVKQNI